MSKTEESASASLVHLVHRVNQLAEELYSSAAPMDSLTPRQLVVLEFVAKGDSPSQTMICRKTGIDRSTLADIVRRLVKKGLLKRRRTREDARRYAVRLTEVGAERMRGMLPALRETDRQLTAELPPHLRAPFQEAIVLLAAKAEQRIAI